MKVTFDGPMKRSYIFLWRCGVVVITIAQLHLTKPEFRFCSDSIPARNRKICNGENIWRWARLETRLKLIKMELANWKLGQKSGREINETYHRLFKKVINLPIYLRMSSLWSIQIQHKKFDFVGRLVSTNNQLIQFNKKLFWSKHRRQRLTHNHVKYLKWSILLKAVLLFSLNAPS